MIVTMDKYENLPQYGTCSSIAWNGFDDLWNNPDEETVRLQENYQSKTQLKHPRTTVLV